MQTIRAIAALRAEIGQLRRAEQRIALVPTMGALHEGHLTLVRAAQRHADKVVVSIFVNPLQFGANEDLDAYPRREAADAALLADAGVAMLWAPDVATMYPSGHATRVVVQGLDTMLCGAARPGHFDGVATVVSKLFNQVTPDVALFGEKDWQQLAIIRRMASDMDFGLSIVGVPTVRDADGLAMSSRNAYLSPGQRAQAAVLPQSMHAAATALSAGESATSVLAAASAALLAGGFASIDYLELRDGITLAPLDRATPEARLFVAARIGGTRLIDNIAVVVKN